MQERLYRNLDEEPLTAKEQALQDAIVRNDFVPASFNNPNRRWRTLREELEYLANLNPAVKAANDHYIAYVAASALGRRRHQDES